MNYPTQQQPFGHALADLGATDEKIIVIDADLQRATETNFFQEKYPERYFDVGIAEANMVGISAGLALSGKTVFCGTFSSFITQRVCDQVVISVGYCRSNVKLIGVEPGIASGRNGASHQALLDLAIMRAIPGMTVFDPADAIELRAMLKYLAETPGPAYMRVPRGIVPVIFDEANYHFEAGKAAMLRDGKDAAIISGGILLPEAIQAAENLAAKGVQVRVINMGSIKPIDEQAILAAAHDTGCIVTAENHSSYGGLGGAVAEIVCQHYPVPMKILGIQNRFGEVGPNDWLLARFGLNAKTIEKAVIETIEKKG